MKTIINKTVCQYLFVHHLSGWHYSSRTYFKEYWQTSPNALTPKESKAIQTWTVLSTKVFKKSGLFLLEKYLNNSLTKEEAKLIDTIFNTLENRFVYHYNSQYKQMHRVANLVAKKLDNHLIQKTVDFYGSKVNKFPVYITMSYKANKHAGGMQLQGGFFLEFGDYKLNKTNEQMLNILFHEITHLSNIKLSRSINLKLPKKFTGTQSEFLEEAIHGALWSQIGVFSQELFKLSDNTLKLRHRKVCSSRHYPLSVLLNTSWAIREEVKRLIESKRVLNQSIVNELARKLLVHQQNFK